MGIWLCEQNFRDVWRRNESIRAEIGQIVMTHAAKLVVRISENIRNVANRRLFKCMLHKYYTDQYESLVICTNPMCPDCRSRR